MTTQYHMRISLILFIMVSALSSTAQKTLPEGYANASHEKFFGDSSLSMKKTMNRKWFFTSYSGIGVSFNFFKAGSATIMDAPVGLQLNRRLNDHFYGFAGVSAAPVYQSFNQAFLSPGFNKLYPLSASKSNSLGWYSRADLGLMYINDARTFSISGSIGVEQSSNPILLYQQRQAARSNSLTPNR